MIDLGELWKSFYEQQIQQQVPQRLNDEIWVVYYDYAQLPGSTASLYRLSRR